MDFDADLDELIQLHADYHTGKSGLSDKDFKEMLIKLIERNK
jgi:hypothetical protein